MRCAGGEGKGEGRRESGKDKKARGGRWEREQVERLFPFAAPGVPRVPFPFPHSPSPAIALAFNEMRTPYASEREICVQKFGNAYRRNRETNGPFQEHLYHHQTVQRNTEMLFANDERFPFTIVACLP